MIGSPRPAEADGQTLEMLRDLWRHRGLLSSLVRRDFRVRSLRAVWGSTWFVVQPAIQIAIYTLIFSQVLRAKLPGLDDGFSYSLYLCAGILSWQFFTEIVSRGQTLFLDHAALIKAIRFPRSTLPLALVASATLNFAIAAGIFLLVLLATGRWPGWVLLAALPPLFVQTALALALAVLCGTLNVFYRDVGHIADVVLQFWFWLTPIVYPVSILPEAARSALAWNPMFPLVSAYQGVVVGQAAPSWAAVAGVALVALPLSLAAWLVFRRLSPDLVDEL